MACIMGFLDVRPQGHGCAGFGCRGSPSPSLSLSLSHTHGIRPLMDEADKRLQIPVYALIETPRSPDIKSRLFLTDDPALVVLYSQLRQQTLSTLRGASKIGPKAEWDFVLHSAKLYDRMGCDLLGLDLGMSWLKKYSSRGAATNRCSSSKLGVPAANEARLGWGSQSAQATEAAKLSCRGRPATDQPPEGYVFGWDDEEADSPADDVRGTGCVVVTG